MAKKTGRPRKDLEEMEFDGWEMLSELAVFYTAQDCAEKLGFSVDTLERRINEKFSLTFAEFKNKCREGIKSNILHKQYEVAMQGNVTMLMWLGKQYCGQVDKQEVEQIQTGEVKIEYVKKDD